MRQWIYKEYINRENNITHAPYEPELDFYHAVQLGDLPTVSEYLNQDFTSIDGLGILSDNALTNFKYHFVITAAMIARHCIEAGMVHEQAYSLSDYYIQRMDRIRKLPELNDLHREMVTAYTDHMHRKTQIRYSKPVTHVIDYIYSHLHMRLTLHLLATEVSLSPSYLSKIFKKETGISLSDYILKSKLETARNMLLYSEYSPGQISEILGFASQSYFTERFRKEYGLPPAKYTVKKQQLTSVIGDRPN